MRRKSVGVLCAGALVCALAACSSSPDASVRDGSPGGQRIPYWVKGMTPHEVAGRLHVTIPAQATDLRAAYQKGFQDDGLLLAFTLPTPDTKAFVGKLAPASPLSHRASPLPSAKDVKPTTPFAHLGLSEPEGLADVTEGPVCSPCQGELNSLAVALHPLDAQHSQVYLRGVD
ncbi:hypothetical protein ACFYM2_16085 [Streptomyces sp. NPDC006711]|uniref:hypothetical protein n=1 Tax=unclassified Streptomyces TaxID=2593676 RepID=UPI0033D38639